jgi:hypothetical protein
MQTTTNPIDESEPELKNNPTFNVVIVYEDFESGMRARMTWERCLPDLDHQFTIRSSMWKFDVLQLPRLRDIAAHDAAAADMVIISTHGEGELALAVRRWIELWLSQRANNSTALVALHDQNWTDDGKLSPVCAYLRRVAEKGNMDFFFKAGDWRNETFEHGTRTIHRQTTSPVSMLEQTFQDAPALRGWGINE